MESKPERISNLRNPILANEEVFVTCDGVFRQGGIDAVFRPSKGETRRASFNEEMQGDMLLVVSVLLRDKMNCRVRFGICFLRVPLIYQPCCPVPCCQGKLGELAKTVYKTYCTVHFVS